MILELRDVVPFFRRIGAEDLNGNTVENKIVYELG